MDQWRPCYPEAFEISLLLVLRTSCAVIKVAAKNFCPMRSPKAYGNLLYRLDVAFSVFVVVSLIGSTFPVLALTSDPLHVLKGRRTVVNLLESCRKLDSVSHDHPKCF